MYSALFPADITVAPEYLAAAVVLGWLIYRATGRTGGFWRWLAPAEFYRHPSLMLDLRLFLIGRALALSGVIGRLSATTLVATSIAALFATSPDGPTSLSPVVLALLLWIAGDFTLYWIHRVFHRSRLIWPLHAVHHSAEVMTPLTAYRQHPVGLLLASVGYAAIIGVFQGLLIGTLDPSATVTEIAGVNAFIVFGNFAMSNFHHSHIRISYGPVFGRLFISPAQHQIHHSTLPAHHDKNFGTFLAVWDWMFGTLYPPKPDEVVTFGLTGERDAPLRTHMLGPSFWSPLQRMWTRSG